MSEDKKGNILKCFWGCRMEILGVFLILIATFLTIISLDSLGIVALFIVGGLLCCHQCFNGMKMCQGGQDSQAEQPQRKNPRQRNRSRKPASPAASPENKE